MNSEERSTQETADEFARRLRTIRKRQGLSQADLAQRSQLTPAAISQLEGGQREPNFSTIVKIARGLRTSPNELMGIGDDQALDPSLRPLFRKVKELSASDAETVQAFAEYLAQKAKDE